MGIRTLALGSIGFASSVKILFTGTLFQKPSFFASMTTELMKLIGYFPTFVHFRYGYGELDSFAMFVCFVDFPTVNFTYLLDQENPIVMINTPLSNR